MTGARESLKASAQASLSELLEPELELEIAHRFLPQNEVRITLSSRNIDKVTIRLVGMPSEDGPLPGPATLAQLRESWTSGEPTLEQLHSEETVYLRGRNPNDWRTREISLGDSFMAGWYGVIVEAAGVGQRGLILGTPPSSVPVGTFWSGSQTGKRGSRFPRQPSPSFRRPGRP